MRACTIGDLHIKKPNLLRLFGHALHELQMNEVRKVLDYAIENDINEAFFLGDIGDDEYLGDPGELALLKLLLEYDGRINMRIILGNHDVEQKHVHSLCKIDLLAKNGLFKSVFVYAEHTIEEIEGVTVEFMPFPATQPKRKETVCVAHLERPGALRDNGTKIEHGVEEPKGNNLWLIGHLHTPQILGNSYFSGTLYQTNMGESLPKGFLDVRVRMHKKQLQHKIEFIENDPDFKLITLNPQSLEDIEISENLLYKYRILYPQDLELPTNFLLRNPNVVECKPYSSKRELKEMLVPESINYKITDGLPDLMRTRGHSERDIKKAQRKVRMVARKTGLPL